MSDKALIPIALHPVYSGEAEYRAELLRLVQMANLDEQYKARLFENMTSNEATQVKDALKRNLDDIAQVMLARCGHDFVKIKELSLAIRPHITRMLTDVQAMQWHLTGMGEQIVKEKLSEGLERLAAEVLKLPDLPPAVKSAAEMLLKQGSKE